MPWLLTAVHKNQTPAISQSQADYDFGQAIHFSLRLEGEGPISAVTLFFQSAENPVTTAIDLPISEDFTGLVNHSVSLAEYRLAPFTTVTYWWQVMDGTGTVFNVPAQFFVYEDDRFEWQQLSADNIIVRWANEDAALGQLALDLLNSSQSRITAVLPVNLPDPLRIYIYPSAADLQASLRLTGRDWVGGHASPALGVILVTAANSRTAAADLDQSIPHELAHLILYQVTGNAYETIPAWFNEGFAGLMEANPDPNEQFVLDEALANGTTIPFSELCAAFPADARLALLAYAQSKSLIGYIQAQYGNGRLNQMARSLADGANCESVVSRGLGISLNELNENWLAANNAQPTLFSLVRGNLIWLLLLLAGFVMMALLLWPLKQPNS